MGIMLKIKTPSVHHTISLTETPTMLGRSRSCDLKIEDEKLSSRHCLVYLQNGLATIRDLGSSNGTMINGSRVSESHLYIEDEIQVGETIMYLLSEKMTTQEKNLHIRNYQTSVRTFVNIDASGLEAEPVEGAPVFKNKKALSAPFFTKLREKKKIKNETPQEKSSIKKKKR
ncbi:MAG: FHA domain-containing protein [Pseudomonadota bacterium]